MLPRWKGGFSVSVSLYLEIAVKCYPFSTNHFKTSVWAPHGELGMRLWQPIGWLGLVLGLECWRLGTRLGLEAKRLGLGREQLRANQSPDSSWSMTNAAPLRWWPPLSQHATFASCLSVYSSLSSGSRALPHKQMMQAITAPTAHMARRMCHQWAWERQSKPKIKKKKMKTQVCLSTLKSSEQEERQNGREFAPQTHLITQVSPVQKGEQKSDNQSSKSTRTTIRNFSMVSQQIINQIEQIK